MSRHRLLGGSDYKSAWATLIWRVVCQAGVVGLAHGRSLVGGVGSAGWVAVRRACARRAVGLISAGLGCRRTVDSSWGRSGVASPGRGLLIALSRVPRALPGRHRPSRRDGIFAAVSSFDAGDGPAEAGELAGGGDGDDRAAFGALLKACRRCWALQATATASGAGRRGGRSALCRSVVGGGSARRPRPRAVGRARSRSW